MKAMLEAFFKCINEDVSTMEECEEKVQRAICTVADGIHIGKMVFEVNAPSTNLRPEGEHHVGILFDRKKDVSGEIHEWSYPIQDGGRVSIRVQAQGAADFTEAERKLLTFLCGEVFHEYSRIMMQNLLLRVVHTDLTTGIPNIEAFYGFAERLTQMGHIQQYDSMFINIHNFKYVNKVFSYQEGDGIIREYAARLQSMLTGDEMIARLGGDNFVVLILKEHSDAFLKQVQNMRLSYSSAGKEKTFTFGATVGIGDLSELHSSREVIGRASIAYQAARQRGVGSAVRYSEQIQQILMENQSIISNFMPALEAQEFVVYYQPKIRIDNHGICGAEALVRWIRKGKLIAPDKFIPQLEREGSICALDYYVLDRVCMFLRKRLDQGKKVSCISVNFSRRHLEEKDLVQHIIRVVDKYRVPHEYIEIELTESDNYQNYEIMAGIVKELKEHGICTAMDDFGKGFSSLNMIKTLKLDVIKIDKSFIPLEEDYPNKERDMVMFCNIVQLIKQMGMKTVAEGVETTGQMKYLKEVGCDIVQGYLFDKPLPEQLFEQRLEEGYERA